MSESTDPKMLEALRRDREAPPPGDAQARVAARLGVVAPVSAPPRRAGPVRAAGLSGARAAVTLTATFILGGAAGVWLHARWAPAPAPRIVYVDRPLPLPHSAAPEAFPPPAAATSGDALPRISTATPSAPSPMTARGGITQLDAERALLDESRAALVREESDEALGALGRYARTFPHPQLDEEHDALVVQALVRARRYDEARSRAAAFKLGHPQSLLLPAVDAAVASIP